MNTARPPAPEPLDLDDLMARIREAAGKGDAAYMSGADPQYPLLQDLVSRFGSFAQRKVYRLRDFLAVPEADFLAYAYQAILKRTPDEADYSFYRMGLYANGNRVFVLASILWSEEAQRHRVQVRGLRWTALFKPLPGKRLLKPVLGAWERFACAIDPGFGLAVELDELRRGLEASHQGLYQALQECDCYGMQLKRRLKYLECRVDQADARLAALVSQARAPESRIGTSTSATANPGSPTHMVPSEVPEQRSERAP